MPRGKISQCYVSKYDSDNMVFRTGETFCGFVVFQIEGEVNVKEISVKLLGQAIMHVSKQKLHREPLIDLKSVLFKPEDTAVLNSGPHGYYFRFECPQSLMPSSVEGRHGTIRYWFRIKVKHSRFSSNAYQFPFTLLSDIDVGTIDYQTSKTLRAHKTVPKHLFFGKSGKLHLCVALDATGFCPGEKIPVILTVKNDSSRDLGRVKVDLIQKMSFRPFGSGSKRSIRNRTRLFKGNSPLSRMSWLDFDNLNLDIRAIPPSSIPGLPKYITVEYFLEVFMSVPWKTKLKVTIPITIGTIPAGFQKLLEVRPWGRSDTFTKAVFSPPLEVRQCTAGFEIFEIRTLEGFSPELCVPMTSFNSSPSIPTLQSSRAEPNFPDSDRRSAANARHPSAPVLSLDEVRPWLAQGGAGDVKDTALPSYSDLFPASVTTVDEI